MHLRGDFVQRRCAPGLRNFPRSTRWLPRLFRWKPGLAELLPNGCGNRPLPDGFGLRADDWTPALAGFDLGSTFMTAAAARRILMRVTVCKRVRFLPMLEAMIWCGTERRHIVHSASRDPKHGMLPSLAKLRLRIVVRALSGVVSWSQPRGGWTRDPRNPSGCVSSRCGPRMSAPAGKNRGRGHGQGDARGQLLPRPRPIPPLEATTRRQGVAEPEECAAPAGSTRTLLRMSEMGLQKVAVVCMGSV